MEYLAKIRAVGNDPAQLEELYQTARRTKAEAFAAAMQTCYEQSPDNVLYAAWHYRLRQAERGKGRAINWKLAVPLSIAAGLIFWILSWESFDLPRHIPYLALTWAPVGASFVIAFLTLTSGVNRRWSVGSIAALLVAGLYVTLFVALQRRDHYQTLMLIHLPALAWIATGISVLKLGSDRRNRFAFLIKTIEVFVTGGLYVIAGGAFARITMGMFEALDISLSEGVMRLLFAGGFGLIPVLATAGVYDPHVPPIEQRFGQGLGRVIYTLMRLMMPLTLLVLVIYLIVIPFNFMEPFQNRDVLIVYNVMLFAVIGLLIGATPLAASEAPKHQRVLRAGIIAVAVLATVISVYALSATVYRTVLGGITINRLAVIGWNAINIGILVALVYKQLRDGAERWVQSVQSVFSWGTNAYLAWTLFLILAIPLLFKG